MANRSPAFTSSAGSSAGRAAIIGTNKPDSVETVDLLLEDFEADRLPAPAKPDPQAVDQLLQERKVRYVTYADWLIIDRLEQERGAAISRSRLKFSRIKDMLDALEAAKQSRAWRATEPHFLSCCMSQRKAAWRTFLFFLPIPPTNRLQHGL